MTAPPGRQTLAVWPVGAAYIPPLRIARKPSSAWRGVGDAAPYGAPHFCMCPRAQTPPFYYLLSIYYLQHSWYDIPNPNIYHKKERSILTTNEKIAALRAAAKAAGADGVLIMTSDPHCRPFRS